MAERHEWGWDEDVDGVHFLYCRRCPETIFPDEILSRLNEYETLKKATEVLSAEDAIRGANIQSRVKNSIGYDFATALRAYADILSEG